MRGEALQMPDGRRHPFPAEPIERPDQQQVELASRGAGKHRTELPPVFDALAAILVLDVLALDGIAHTAAPCTELPELVLRVLPFVVCRNPGVDRYPHRHEPSPLWPSRAATNTDAFSRR